MLFLRLQHGIEVVVDPLKVGDGDLDQSLDLVRVFDHVDAQLQRIAPGGGALHAGMQIGVAHQ